MRIAYHHPYPTTLNAHRTISHGFEHAFTDMWHEFRFFTPDDDFHLFFDLFQPDIFITCSHFLYQKYIDYSYMQNLREKWLIVFTKIDFWSIPKGTNQKRISEASGMKDDISLVEKIKKGELWDIFFHVVAPTDTRMIGFTEGTWYTYHTIPLAVDASLVDTHIRPEFSADISFIGTNSPDKYTLFSELLFPLQKLYNTRIYGQDWTIFDRYLGWIQRFGQYFNISGIKSIRKPKLKLSDEWDIYASSKICVNIHEQNQRLCGGDVNERFFKIPAFGGFQISDSVACIGDYFDIDTEIVVAKDTADWFTKINYYMHHSEERNKIMQAGRKRSLRDHTYHSRVGQILQIYREYTESRCKK